MFKSKIIRLGTFDIEEEAAKEYDKKAIELMDELKTMGLMVSCQGGFICSNSSFAWLGAWIGAHQAGSIICTPKRWYNLKDASNFIPRDWVRVEE
jgi:hypothetical protein